MVLGIELPHTLIRDSGGVVSVCFSTFCRSNLSLII